MIDSELERYNVGLSRLIRRRAPWLRREGERRWWHRFLPFAAYIEAFSPWRCPECTGPTRRVPNELAVRCIWCRTVTQRGDLGR